MRAGPETFNQQPYSPSLPLLLAKALRFVKAAPVLAKKGHCSNLIFEAVNRLVSRLPNEASPVDIANAVSVAFSVRCFDLWGSESTCSKDFANLGGRVFFNALQAPLGRWRSVCRNRFPRLDFFLIQRLDSSRYCRLLCKCLLAVLITASKADAVAGFLDLWCWTV